VGDFSKIPQIISQNARVLIAPLDWGLGHATRCIPLVDFLITQLNAKITIAANGPQKAILQEAFPQLPFLHPPDYQVNYRKNRAATIASLALAVPRILRTIRAENRWLKNLLQTQSFDAIISDNRYGCYDPVVPSYFITHQLLVKTPFGPRADRLLQKALYRYINRFKEVWVPDNEKAPALAGELSHPNKMPGIPVRYLGPISRLDPRPKTGTTQLLVLLSGPEPQRSLLEKIVFEQWLAAPGTSMVCVRGLPTTTEATPLLPNAIIYNHLQASALAQEIANAGIILCRSGYSTIMDLLPMGKKCVMVPTPGQTEQEYLAGLLAEQGRIRTVSQNELRLAEILH
jgi:hypothetical protein